MLSFTLSVVLAQTGKCGWSSPPTQSIFAFSRLSFITGTLSTAALTWTTCLTSIRGTAPCSCSKAWTERSLPGTIFQWLPLNYVSPAEAKAICSDVCRKMYMTERKAMCRTIWKKNIQMVISAFEGAILARLQANFTSPSPATDFTLLPKWKSLLVWMKSVTYIL